MEKTTVKKIYIKKTYNGFTSSESALPYIWLTFLPILVLTSLEAKVFLHIYNISILNNTLIFMFKFPEVPANIQYSFRR